MTAASTLGAALDYVGQLGLPSIASYERQLLGYAIREIGYAIREMSFLPGLRMVGNAPENASALTFVLDWLPVRRGWRGLGQARHRCPAGHHCAQPILCRYGLEAAVRPSLAMYPAGGPRPVSAGYMRAIVGGGGTHGCA